VKEHLDFTQKGRKTKIVANHETRPQLKTGVGNLFTITGRTNCALSRAGRK